MRAPSAAAIAALALTSPSHAQDAQGPHELPAGPPAPARPVRTSPARPVHPPIDPAAFTSIQVNVTADGDNILDDAANEPSIAVDPTAPNRMAIGWRQFDSIDSDFRQAGHAWTIDGGRTWTFPGVLDEGVFRSDPVLRSAADGRMYYYSLTLADGEYTCQLFTSDDAGQSWAGPLPAYGGDKAWIAIDRTGGPGFDSLYAAWDHAGCCGDDWFTRSRDGGASFDPPVPIAGRPIWGSSAVGPDGVYYMSGRSSLTNTKFVVSRSANAQDPGADPTFEYSEVALGGAHTYLGNGPNPGGLMGQVWVGVNAAGGPGQGDVYVLCSVNPPDSDPADVMFARSKDGGHTWAQPVKVNHEAPGTNAWQWFGTMSVAPNGRIDVVWNDTVTAQSSTSELRYSFSIDGGESWSEPQTLGPVWNSLIGWPLQQKIGDYYDMESDRVGVSLAYAATYNGEQDVYFLRIGDYDCNGNGVGDAGDLAGGLAKDCDADGVPDSCEIAAGAEDDANGDGVPDSCGMCYADYNDDGKLDLFDFLAFVNSFNEEEAGADCTGDGPLDLFDFLCFVNAFNQGC
jgi:hypothetical protein